MKQGHEVIAFGRTAEILTYDQDRVLKLYRSYIPVAFVEAEFKISMSVYHAGIASPEPFEIIDYDGRKGIVYQRVSGKTMLKSISEKPWSVGKEAVRMARVHHNIHEQSVSGLPKQKEILTERIEQAPILSLQEKEKIIEYLSSLREDSKLCHGDFHPDNIILGDREWIIDWMTGMVGNPAGDVARTVLLLRLGTMPDEIPRVIKYMISRIRKQLLNRYLIAYNKESKLNNQEINQWIVPVAAARLCESIPDQEKNELVKLIRNSFL